MTTDTSTQTDLPDAELGPPDEAAAEAEAQAEADAIGEHVVAFGCRIADRVFIGVGPGQRNQSYTLKIPDCPGCGQAHEVTAMPRPRRPHDEISLTIDPPSISESSAPPREPSGRSASKSDAEIVAAIPAEWTTAKAVAESLGYNSYRSFTNRLREMRQRAAAKGEAPPFENDPSPRGLKVRAAR